ncbi:MAG: NUDIX domain-containing protein [Bdellovibrionota bacterium]
MSLPFSKTYIGRLRSLIGKQPLIMPAFRTIIENEKGEILLCLRTDFKKWALPAGYPELGESMPDCIRRECNEEAGINVKTFETFGYASRPEIETMIYPNGDAVQSFCILTYSRDFSGEAKPVDGEMSQVKFFSYEEIPENALQNELLCIRAFQEFKKNGKFQWL